MAAFYLATAFYQRDVDVDNLVLPDQHTDGKVDHGQRGNDGLDDTVDQADQHDDGIVGHLQTKAMNTMLGHGVTHTHRHDEGVIGHMRIRSRKAVHVNV